MKSSFVPFAILVLVCCQVLIFAQQNDPPVRRNKPPVHDKFRNQLKGTNQKYSNPNGLLKSFNSNHPTSISDLTEFQELPYQDPNISYYEVTPIALSNGNIMMIWASWDTFNFTDDDTLYCATSSDGGLTWDNKKIITHLPFDAEYYLTGLQTISGRVIIFWTDNFSTVVTKMIFSDNNGDSWSSVFSIGSSYPSWYPSVSQSINGTIYLSYSRDISGDFSYSDIVFRTSIDDGLTWSAEKIIADDQSNQYACNVIPVSEEELLAIYNKETNDNLQIFKRISTNGGNSWSTETTILDNPEDYEYLPRVIRLNNDSLCIVFVNTADWPNDDLYYSFSADNGNNWSTPVQFTRYVGWDVYVPNFTFYNNKPFIAFASARWQQVYDVPHVWYGIAGITEDDNPPPAVNYSDVYKSYFAPDKVETILANIADESGLQNAQVNLSLNGGAEYSLQLFDDGQHNDWGVGDDIYGIPIGPFSLGDHLDYNFSVTDVDNNTINVHGFAIDVVQHSSPVNPNKGFEETPVGVTGGDITGWGLYQSSPASAEFEIVDDTVKEGNRALKINVTTLGVNPWDIQTVNYPFPVEPDAQYRYFIWAKADKDSAFVNFTVGDPSFNEWLSAAGIPLTTKWQEYSFDFFTPSDASTGRSANHFGGSGNSTSLPIKFYIDDLRIVKLDLTVGVENDLTEIPTEFSLRQNYPNPFNPSTKISWQSPVGGRQVVKVFDVLGNEIRT